MPLFVFGHEDGADQVLVELNGEDCVEFVGSAESDQIEAYGVWEGYMAVVKIRLRRANGGKRSRPGSVVRGLELRGKRLWRRDWQIHGGKLQRTEAWSGERRGLRRCYLL